MIAFKYILFAILSTVLNLTIQYISFELYSGFLSLYLAMVSGTLSGLILKYILDKKFIFYHKPKDIKDNNKKFILYSIMGLFTTVIFWGFEITFEILWNQKYLGAVLGLSIGYVVKYFLDKKYVFIKGKK
jgi:putative flippase GtrA